MQEAHAREMASKCKGPEAGRSSANLALWECLQVWLRCQVWVVTPAESAPNLVKKQQKPAREHLAYFHTSRTAGPGMCSGPAHTLEAAPPCTWAPSLTSQRAELR